MRERIDTFQVGPAPPGQISGLVEDVTPAVLVEARITANERNIHVKAIERQEGPESIAHVYIEYTEDPTSPFSFDKTSTVVVERYDTGIYAPE